MSQIKAGAIPIIKKMLQAHSPEAIEEVRQQLSPEVKNVFDNVVSTSRITWKADAEILKAASKTLYPMEPLALKRLGQEVAKIQFTGMYKAFLRIASMSYILDRTNHVWKTINSKGEALAENVTKNSATVVIKGNPEYEPAEREYTSGVLVGIAELTGASNVKVYKEENDADAWKWHMRWE